MEINHKKIYYINTRNRINGTDSSFAYQLEIPPDSDYNKIVLLSCSIPKSFYIVPDGATFDLYENGTTTTITVAKGNYNRTNFRTYLQTILNLHTAHAYVYAVSYSTMPDTGKYTISVSGNAGNQPRIITNDLLFEQLGFDRDSTNYFVASSLTSTNVIKFVQEDALFLHCGLCDNNGDNILKEIFASGTPDFGIIDQTTSDIFTWSKELTTNKSNIYHFQLTNEDNQEIDLNGLNANYVIMLYNERILTEVLSKAINYFIK